MSHFAKIRDDFVAKEAELKQRMKTVDELAELTKKLEEQKRALAEKSAELSGQKNRLEILSNLAAPLDAALKTKTTSEDVLQQVLEAVIRSEQMSPSDIMQRTVNIAKGVGGRTRGDVLNEVLDGLIDDEQGLDAAIDWAMADFASVNDVVKSALTAALRQGAKPAALLEVVAKTAYDMLGDKAQAATAQPIKETPIVNLPRENVKDNAATGNRSQSTPDNKNGLRGQADDFKPRSATPNGNQNGGGWEAFARENGVGNVGEQNKASTGAGGTGWGNAASWGSIPGWGL